MVMLVAFGIAIVGSGFGAFLKNKENLRMHRWVLSAAVLLGFGTILLVMLPTLYNFYTDPDVEALSALSIVTIIHGILGFPAIVAGVVFLSGDLPGRIRYWMRVAILFWIVGTLSGLLLFLQMAGLLGI